ncbi:MAG TPA: hypothetical protein VF152_02165 [Acidimicrobiia bacterium]
MAGRTWAGLVGLAAGVSAGALVLAQVVSHPVASAGLFLVFLVGLFGLLAGALIASDQWVQGVWATPEQWPQWIQRRRVIRFLLRGVRGALRALGTGLGALAAGALTRWRGLARLRTDVTRDALRRNFRAALDALGLPLEEPDVVPEPAATIEHALASRRPDARHPRADPDGHDDRRSFLPAQYRATRDALEKACQGAKVRNAALEAHAAGSGGAGTGELRRAFTPKRGRAAREALKSAGHHAFVAAIGILPDRRDSLPTR